MAEALRLKLNSFSVTVDKYTQSGEALRTSDAN